MKSELSNEIFSSLSNKTEKNRLIETVPPCFGKSSSFIDGERKTWSLRPARLPVKVWFTCAVKNVYHYVLIAVHIVLEGE